MTRVKFEYEKSPWSAMTSEDLTAWRRLRDERPALASPFFSPGWHDAVHAIRGDVEVVRIRRDGEVCGFLPFARCPFGMLRPVGAPMADWHGLVGPAGLTLDVDEILRAAGGRAFRFSGAAADDAILEGAASDVSTSFVMDVSGGYDAYRTEAAKAHPKAFRNLRARMRKVHGRSVEIRHDDRDPESLAMLLAMKRAQYRRTRQIDIFGFRWTRALVESLFAQEPLDEPESVRGLLSTLWIDGTLAAGHFGLQGDETLHYWFPVYDARFAELSPGIVLLHEIAMASAQLGIQRIDLGDGDYRFKQEFANRRLPIIAGTARLASPSRRLASRRRPATPTPTGSPRLGLARLPRAVSRRVDLLSSLHIW